MQSFKRTPETKRLSELSLYQNHARILAEKYALTIPYLYNSVMMLRRQISALHVVGVLFIIVTAFNLDMLQAGLSGAAICFIEAWSRARRFKTAKRLVLVLLKRHRAFLAIEQTANEFKKVGYVSPEILADISWLLTSCGRERK